MMLWREPSKRWQASLAGHFARKALILLLAGAPAAWVLAQAVSAGRTCANDYWIILSTILEGGHFSTSLARWLEPHNQVHFMPLSKLVYAANVWLTDGSNHGLAVTTWALFLGRWMLLLVLARRADPAGPSPLETLFISVFCFSPGAGELWFHGYAGVHSMGADVLALFSIAALCRAANPGWKDLALALVAGVSAWGFFSSALALWPALMLVAFLRPMTAAQRAVIAAAGLGALLGYALLVDPASRVGSGMDAERSALFLLSLLGGIFTFKVEIAALLGLLGLVAGAGLFARRVLGGERLAALAPWWAMATYALVTAAMMALGRSQLGIEEAVTSRYAHVASLYWLAVIMIGLRRTSSTRRPRAAIRMSLPLLAAGLVIAMVRVGGIRSRGFLEQARLQPAAELSLHMGIDDPLALRSTISLFVDGKNTLWEEVERLGHVPFDRSPALLESLGRRAEPDDSAPPIGGEIKLLSRTRGFVRAGGWIDARPSELEELVLADEQGVIRGLALPVPERLVWPRGADSRMQWMGYAHDAPSLRTLRLFARRPDQPGFSGVGPAQPIASQPRPLGRPPASDPQQSRPPRKRKWMRRGEFITPSWAEKYSQ